jgi:hypothetical protein
MGWQHETRPPQLLPGKLVEHVQGLVLLASLLGSLRSDGTKRYPDAQVSAANCLPRHLNPRA